MSAQAAHDPLQENSAVLRLRRGPLAAPVLCRVVAMMLARADCPVDRLDDAMLVCDALSAHAPDHSDDGRVDVTVTTDADGLQLRVGALAPEGAARLMEDAALPGVGNVLAPIADEVRVQSGRHGGQELVLALRFERALAGDDPNGDARAA